MSQMSHSREVMDLNSVLPQFKSPPFPLKYRSECIKVVA